MSEKEDPKKYQIKLTNVRLSYPVLFKPKAMEEGQDPKYSAAFLLDKKEHKALIAEIKTKIESLKAEKNLKVPADKVCLKDGELKEDVDGYGPDVMFVNTSNKTRPTVVNRDRSPVTEDDGVVYGGCYVNAVIRLWAQNNSWGKRINASLEAVQFVSDGEAFGAPKVDIEEVFDDESNPAD